MAKISPTRIVFSTQCNFDMRVFIYILKLDLLSLFFFPTFAGGISQGCNAIFDSPRAYPPCPSRGAG